MYTVNGNTEPSVVSWVFCGQHLFIKCLQVQDCFFGIDFTCLLLAVLSFMEKKLVAALFSSFPYQVNLLLHCRIFIFRKISCCVFFCVIIKIEIIEIKENIRYPVVDNTYFKKNTF
jgi:hypothetical protein